MQGMKIELLNYNLALGAAEHPDLIADPVDNTVLILAPETVVAANNLGSKRFIYSKNDQLPPPPGAIHFGRDRVLDLEDNNLTHELQTQENLHFYVGRAAMEAYIKQYYQVPSAFYQTLNEKVFPLAQYTEIKQQEFDVAGVNDKFCRFNGHYVVPILMTDAQGQLLGCIRMLVQAPLAYLADEIIAIPDLEKNSERHQYLLGALFNQVGAYAREHHISTAFIRAAAEREQQYEALGCSPSHKLYVIHGAPTDEFKKYKDIALEAAARQLADLDRTTAISTSVTPFQAVAEQGQEAQGYRPPLGVLYSRTGSPEDPDMLFD